MAKNPKEKTKGIRKVRAQGGDSKFVAFTDALVRIMEDCDKDGVNVPVIAMTDEGLVDAVNRQLPEHERISVRSFQNYKAGKYDGIAPEELSKIGVFISCYKRALDGQRAALVDALRSDVPGGWQRYAWLLERKFDDFNLRAKSVDETPDVGRLVVRVKT